MSGVNIDGEGLTVGGEGVDVGETGYEPVGTPFIYWPADEGTGSTLNDAVGSEDGSLFTGVGWRADAGYVGGTALNNDGSGYVDTTTWGGWASGLPSNGGALVFTIETTDTGMLMSSLDSNSHGFEVMTNGEFEGTFNKLNFVARDTSENPDGIRSSQDVNDGGRYRAALSGPNGSIADWSLYLNGSDETNVFRNEGSNLSTDLPYDTALFARNEDGNISFRHAGEMDAIQVYDYELTSSEVQEDYNRQPWS